MADKPMTVGDVVDDAINEINDRIDENRRNIEVLRRQLYSDSVCDCLHDELDFLNNLYRSLKRYENILGDVP